MPSDLPLAPDFGSFGGPLVYFFIMCWLHLFHILGGGPLDHIFEENTAPTPAGSGFWGLQRENGTGKHLPLAIDWNTLAKSYTENLRRAQGFRDQRPNILRD